MRGPAVLLAAALLAPAPGALAFPGPEALAPLARDGGPERHTPDTLWERIDGEAELYRTYGLAGSEHARYRLPSDPDRAVELSVFTMSDALGAFGLFAAYRPRSCGTPEPLGGGACLDDYQGLLWHGAVFAVADASGPAATRAGDVRRALEAVADELGPPPPPPGPLREFSLVADPRTVRYQPQHLLGREALPPGLEGVAAGVTVFRAVGGGNPAAALERYAGELVETRRSRRGGLEVLEGRDRALGPVTLVSDPGGGLAGARALPGDPGVWEALTRLLPAGGDGTPSPAR